MGPRRSQPAVYLRCTLTKFSSLSIVLIPTSYRRLSVPRRRSTISTRPSAKYTTRSRARVLASNCEAKGTGCTWASLQRRMYALRTLRRLVVNASSLTLVTSSTKISVSLLFIPDYIIIATEMLRCYKSRRSGRARDPECGARRTVLDGERPENHQHRDD